MHASSVRPLLDSGTPVAGVSPLAPRRRRIAVTFGMSMPSKVAGDLQERLAAILETSDELQRNRTELMRQMRLALRDMRAARERLQAQHRSDGRPRGAGPAASFAGKYHLTPRELEVALLLAAGASNAAIATALRISEHTARHHTRHVLVKLGLHSRARAAALVGRELGAAAPALP
jgi:DNA-binding CsgD family transcriptional regulator